MGGREAGDLGGKRVNEGPSSMKQWAGPIPFPSGAEALPDLALSFPETWRPAWSGERAGNNVSLVQNNESCKFEGAPVLFVWPDALFSAPLSPLFPALHLASS